MKDDYKIYNTMLRKSTDIQLKISELNQTVMEVGQAMVLSAVCKMLDSEAPIPEIRKAIDLWLSDLSMEAIDFYCELKAKGDIK